MKRIEQIKSAIAKNMGEFRTAYNVRRMGIFGSYVRGEQKKGSDIDVLVEFSSPIGLFEFLKLEEALADMLGAKVDLVSKKALKPGIGERVLKEVVYV